MDPAKLSQLIGSIASLDHLGAVKAVIAAVALALLVLERRMVRRITERQRQMVGVVLAIVAISSYFHFFQLDHKNYYHRWELFHYYVGSKYVREIGYERLYACAAIADAETGNERGVRYRRMRDLTVDLLVPAREALAHPQECKNRFSPERWTQFRSDVVWFRQAAASQQWWSDMQGDHGYNPSPVWAIAGRALSSAAPPSDGYFKQLAAIDVTLTALMFMAIGWAFGWRVLLIAAVYWSTQEPLSFFWTGGSFLRQDWLFLGVLSIALMRKGWFFWAGAALAISAMLRMFPVLLWAGPLVVIASHVWRRREFPSRYRRLIMGGAVACCLLLPAGRWVSGPDCYREFIHHLQVHDSSPITNHMSLRTMLSATPEGRLKYALDRSLRDPMQRWQQLRRERLQSLKPVFWAVLSMVFAALGWVCWKLRTPWIAMALSLSLVVTVVDPTCYYYCIWILAAVLTRVRRSLEIPIVGLAAASQFVSMGCNFVDDKYASLAGLYVVCTVAALGVFMRPFKAKTCLDRLKGVG
jgi:hypothetical protein